MIITKASPGEPVEANNGYEWSLSVNGACAKEHASADFTAFVDDYAGPDSCASVSDITGAVYTRIGFQPYIMTVDTYGDDDQRTYEGRRDVGLAQAFPEGPGSYLVAVRVVYPKTGSQNIDVDCILGQLGRFEISAAYKEHKA